MFAQPLIFFALKGIETIENAHFFIFFTIVDLVWPNFCPKTTPTFILFAWFLMKYVRGRRQLSFVPINGQLAARGDGWKLLSVRA